MTISFIAGVSINSYAPKSCWLGQGYWSYELYGAGPKPPGLTDNRGQLPIYDVVWMCVPYPPKKGDTAKLLIDTPAMSLLVQGR